MRTKHFYFDYCHNPTDECFNSNNWNRFGDNERDNEQGYFNNNFNFSYGQKGGEWNNYNCCQNNWDWQDNCHNNNNWNNHERDCECQNSRKEHNCHKNHENKKCNCFRCRFKCFFGCR